MLRTIMSSIVRAGCILVLAGNAANAQSAVAGHSVSPAIKWTDKQAKAAGWVSRKIDFGVDHISYTTFFPSDAKIETVPVEGDITGPGKVTIIGKYSLPSAAGDITATVIAYRLRDTGSALRLCSHTLGRDGYVVQKIEKLDPDETHAQIMSASFNEQGAPQEGVLSDCRTRGNTVLAHHFFFSVADTPDGAALDARIGMAGDVFLPLVSGIVFADGKPDGYGETAVPVALNINGKMRTIHFPDVFSVAFNDFDGRKGTGQRELHLLQQKDDVAKSMVWLGASDMPQKPDLAKVGPESAVLQFRLQAAKMPEPKLVSNEADDSFAEQGIAVQRFVFSVPFGNGKDAVSLAGEAWWHGGKLYVLTWFSNYPYDGSLSSFIARLPGQTAYNLVRDTALEALQ